MRSGLFKRVGNKWVQPEDASSFASRVYESYDDYVAHQASKLGVHELSEYDVQYPEVLKDRLQKTGLEFKGRNVLCLAARIGTEVKAFLGVGGFAVGIDLNPGAKNRYVLHGDFHDLQFATGSVDYVFTNSLDHAFQIERILKEVLRVLKPDGAFIVEAVAGETEGKSPGFFESFAWKSIDHLVALIESQGFKLIARSGFDYPWPGSALIFRPGSGGVRLA